MAGFLIKDTTREEREQIVADSLGNIDAYCDGCMCGITEMYQDYIDGKKELREINMEFNARYVRDEDGSEHMVTTLIICMWQSWESHVNMDIQLAGLQ